MTDEIKDLDGSLQESMIMLGSVYLHLQLDGYPDSKDISQALRDLKGKHVRISVEVLA